MNAKSLVIFALWLLTVSAPVHAEPVQSSTSAFLTFRHCVSGETVCDSILPFEVGRYGGLPGEPAAIVSHADPTFGKADGSARLTGAPGAAELSANAISLPSTRNGSNCVTVQRYTNKGATAETLTFDASLAYKQTIPAENEDFPADSPARSGAFAEIFIFSMGADSLEAGTTAEENATALMEGSGPSIVLTELAFAGSAPLSNVTESGKEVISGTVTVEPGDSIWLWALLQSLAANGAEVSATMETRLESTKAE